jgi:hypothetical protein
MPKKTKKQKILAELRRKKQESNPRLEFVNTQISHVSASKVESAATGYTFKSKSVAKPHPQISTHDYSYVRHDLLRITIFTAFALIVQGVLYFILKG